VGPSTTLGEDRFTPIDSRFVLRIFYVFMVLALCSVMISIAGKWAGRTIALAGHTEDTTIHEVVIGNNLLAVPANAIRFDQARRDGVAQRLDLYLRWPDMLGYSADRRNEFNNAGAERSILFLSFEKSTMSRDMSGRFEPIYRALIEASGQDAGGGVTLHKFSEKSGYLNEMLAVGDRLEGEPFIARCLTGQAAAESLASCERDVQIGDGLSLSYRFPANLLSAWRALDAAVLTKAEEYLISDGG
jgi:hypothetical protein